MLSMCPVHHPQVHIEPGHRHGSKVVFRGEAGSDSPDVLPGDLIFILEQVRTLGVGCWCLCCEVVGAGHCRLQAHCVAASVASAPSVSRWTCTHAAASSPPHQAHPRSTLHACARTLCLAQKEHAAFKRIGTDLFYEKTVRVGALSAQGTRSRQQRLQLVASR